MIDESAAGSLSAANVILPLLWEHRPFDAVVDVGCGAGAWLKVARELGASQLVGFDSQFVESNLVSIEPDIIAEKDLLMRFTSDRIFDLCICVEVAEHLPEGRSISLVQDLCSLSDVVLFSGAVPYQGGYNHINEQWPQYWADRFRHAGYYLWDGIRSRIWMSRVVPWWYRQNMLLFVNESAWSTMFAVSPPITLSAMPLVHPESVLWNKRDREQLIDDLYRSPTIHRHIVA